MRSGNTVRPIWANETRLGKYQDAEKVLNETSAFYLVKSTFSSVDYLWGTNFTCVRRHYTHQEESFVSLFSFKNASASATYTLNMSTWQTKTYGYNHTNAIEYQLPNCTLLNDTIIFSDVTVCTLMSVPYQNGGKGCELWISEDHLRNDTVPLCCYFLFDMLCAE
ncbi:male-specific histamine-binding salivary protein-like [Dermacentor variabilis]|uniref:male-specific histamine-binding salivary protein-like n=1 Tax=Dermacentor variabilis TaxID=34621 RepID=UPI003F5B13C4